MLAHSSNALLTAEGGVRNRNFGTRDRPRYGGISRPRKNHSQRSEPSPPTHAGWLVDLTAGARSTLNLVLSEYPATMKFMDFQLHEILEERPPNVG